MPGRILVGTSSWADPGFIADWYPPRLPDRERLPFYARRFEAVEVNSTFYAVPGQAAVARWAAVTPDDFVFDVKLHRLLSRHAAPLESLPPDLRDRATTTERGRAVLTPELERALIEKIVAAIEPIERKLGAYLLQLSPAFAPKSHRLEDLEPLLEAFAPMRVAVELRHRGWLDDKRREETFAFLSGHHAIFVGVDAPRGDQVTIMPPLDAVTCDKLAYLRAHGRNLKGYVSGKSVAERFGYVYPDEELDEIKGRAQELAQSAAEVHVMFNNNRSDDAPSAARRLRQLLGQDPGPDPVEQPTLSPS